MLTQRQTHLEKALLTTVAALLLLTRTGQSAARTGSSLTSTAPPVTDSPLTAFLNSTEEIPKAMHSHRGCGSNYSSYCMNGGECMHPQDNDRPFCNCRESFWGIRCEHDVVKTYTLDNMEPMIGIIFGAFMVLVFLAILLYCFAYKRCMKSTPLIKPAPSDISV
uniref:Epigen n=1 Tax=Iconisemion striatum TaxID=60296 RepID=A0A1A7X118_9TELE